MVGCHDSKNVRHPVGLHPQSDSQEEEGDGRKFMPCWPFPCVVQGPDNAINILISPQSRQPSLEKMLTPGMHRDLSPWLISISLKLKTNINCHTTLPFLWEC